MTSILALTTTLIASIIPGIVLLTSNPAATLGFMTVGICMLFAARDYMRPRRVTRHGLRA